MQALALAVGTVHADEPDRLLNEPLAEAFGAPPLVRGLRLSPDGTKISFIQAHPGGGDLLRVFDTASQGVVTAWIGDRQQYDIRWCKWANTERLVCGLRVREPVNSQPMAWERLAAVNADGSQPLLLRTREDSIANVRFEDHVVDWLRDDPEHVLLGMHVEPSSVLHSREILRGVYSSWRFGMSAVRLNIYDNERRIEPGLGRAMDWLSDGHGTVRLGVTVKDPGRTWGSDSRLMWQVREASGWSLLQRPNLEQPADGASPVSFDVSANEVLYLDLHDGRTALFAIDPRDGGAGRLVYSHPFVDVTGVHRLGKYDRVVAATFVEDRPRLHFFDPRVEHIRRTLAAEFPGMTVDVIDEDWSARSYLLFVHSGRDAGTYYVFDSASRVLKNFGRAYPPLGDRGLAVTEPVSYAGAQGDEITGYLTFPSGGRAHAAVVLPRGGPAPHDHVGIDFVAQYLAAKGYAVLRANYRGLSAGVGDWQQASSDVAAGAEYLVASGKVASDRICVVGWGDGAYAAMLSAIEHRDRYRCVAGIASATGSLVTLASRMSDWDDDLRSMPSLANRAAEIDLPTLLFHGHVDLHAPIEQLERFVEAMRESYKDVTLIEYSQAGDDISAARHRIDMLTRLGAFLGSHLGHEASYVYARTLDVSDPAVVVDFGRDAAEPNGQCSDRRFKHLDGRFLTDAGGRPSATFQDATDCRLLFRRGALMLAEDVALNRSGSAIAEDRVTFFVEPSRQLDAAIVRFDDNATGSPGVAVAYARPGYHTVSVQLAGAAGCVVDFERHAAVGQEHYRTVALGDESVNAYSSARIPAHAGHYYRIEPGIEDGMLALRVTDVSEDRVVLDQMELLAAGCAEGGE